MHTQLMSGNKTIFNLSSKPHILSSNIQSSSFISINSSSKNENFCIKNPSRSYKTRTKASVNTYTQSQGTETFYQLLGISESGGISEIKKAYKQLARKYHPDVSPADRTEEYTQRFILVQEAYETLVDPQTRALYDKDLSKGLHYAVSARTRVNYHQRTEEREEWKNRWASQLSELKKIRSNYSDTRESWGSRMRRQHSE